MNLSSFDYRRKQKMWTQLKHGNLIIHLEGRNQNYQTVLSNASLPEVLKACFDRVEIIDEILKGEEGYVIDDVNGKIGLKIWYGVGKERVQRQIELKLYGVGKNIEQVKMRGARLAENMKEVGRGDRTRCRSALKGMNEEKSSSKRISPDPACTRAPDLSLHNLAHFVLRSNFVMYTGPETWHHILLSHAFSSTFRMVVKIVRAKNRCLGIGVTDREQIPNFRSSVLLGNRVCYIGNGIVHYGQPDGSRCLRKGVGFCQDEAVEMLVDLTQASVQWQVKGESRAQIKLPFLSYQQNLVPYFQFYNSGDAIEWQILS